MYVLSHGGACIVVFPVPSNSISGFGRTVSKISRCSFPQPSHKLLGTLHRKTWPSKNMHAEEINKPSRSCIPSLVIDLTWTAGEFTSARMLVNELSCLAGLARMPRDCVLAIKGLRANKENALRGGRLVAPSRDYHWPSGYRYRCVTYLELLGRFAQT